MIFIPPEVTQGSQGESENENRAREQNELVGVEISLAAPYHGERALSAEWQVAVILKFISLPLFSAPLHVLLFEIGKSWWKQQKSTEFLFTWSHESEKMWKSIWVCKCMWRQSKENREARKSFLTFNCYLNTQTCYMNVTSWSKFQLTTEQRKGA